MKKKVNFILSVLFGLLFLNSGLNKFLNYMPAPDDMPEAAGQLMYAFANSGWLFPLIAIVEILGGILYVLPRFRPLGAVIIFPILIGILLFHLVQAPSGILIPFLLLVINSWIMVENREKYLPMIS